MKKVLSLVLAVVLVLGMAVTAFGTTVKPDKNNLVLGASIGGNAGTRRPEDKVTFSLEYIGTGFGPGVTKEMVRALDLDVQIRTTAGSAAIDSAKIKYDDTTKLAYVELKFVEEYVSTKELDYDVTLYLTAKKSRINRDNSNTWATVTGTFANYETTVDEYDEYVYLYDTPVVEALDYIKNIKVDLGEGFAIYTKMFEGKRYYGKVTQEVKAEDEAILAKYPDVDTVYYVKTIGLVSSGNVVAFDLDANLYAYAQDADGNLVYIGRTNDRLPYYTKYFLSGKELDVDVVGDLTNGGDIVAPENPGMGGDDAPVNVNDNPSTGR